MEDENIENTYAMDEIARHKQLDPIVERFENVRSTPKGSLEREYAMDVLAVEINKLITDTILQHEFGRQLFSVGQSVESFLDAISETDSSFVMDTAWTFVSQDLRRFPVSLQDVLETRIIYS